MSATDEPLRRTPFYEIHRTHGARMVLFGGWEMPVQYEGILAEHHAVRSAVGLFDVSHMGRVEIYGPDASAFINYITVNDVNRLGEYTAQYSAMCYDHGGIVDDLLVYRAPDRMMLVINAGNRSKDMDWIRRHGAGFEVDIRDISEDKALLALQGPGAQDALANLTDLPLDQMRFNQFCAGPVAGIDTIVSRNGYTGEDGFELWFPAREAAVMWNALMKAGEPFGLKPCGLGARDTLRLEAGLCLYGHEIDETTNPLEAGLSWITKFKKGDFIGRAALLKAREQGVQRRLIGFTLKERGIPREGYAILHAGAPVGKTVSGTMSPTLGIGIGTGYVPPDLAEPGTPLAIDIRGKPVPAEVVKLPFYKTGSRR